MPINAGAGVQTVRCQSVLGGLRLQRSGIRPSGPGSQRILGICAAGSASDGGPAVREVARQPLGDQLDYIGDAAAAGVTPPAGTPGHPPAGASPAGGALARGAPACGSPAFAPRATTPAPTLKPSRSR